MASSRNLNLLIGLLIVGCSTPAPVNKGSSGPENNQQDRPSEVSGISDDGKDEGPDITLEESKYASTRSRISDTYAYKSQLVTNPFDIKPVVKDVTPTGNQGFRVQITTSDRVTVADSIKSAFDAWADTSNFDYRIYSYIEFKSPNYRVNVGDFYDRNDALQLGKMLRRHFREAWVIYDKIQQERSPYYQRLAKQASPDSL